MDHRSCPLFLVLAVAMVMAGCNAPGSLRYGATEPRPAERTTTLEPFEVMIAADPREYSLMMSSAPGIRLSAWSPSIMPPTGAVYRWETSFGHFLSWEPPSYRVVPLGPMTRRGPEAVYWSYDPIPPGQDLPEVVITLTVSDPTTGASLGHRTLHILRKDNVTSVVGPQS